ncbi:MAG: protein kinase [Phycisphaerales bacterium]
MSETPPAIGPYTVDAEIGRGGMGVVFRATDTRLGRTVAIKALPEHLADDPERLARFEREARTLASLNHPNVAGIHGVEEHEGRRYLVLEFVEGETLSERLDRGPLAPDEALEVCAQVAAGVEAAHEAGVIHRDLKPANIKVTPDGRVKVLDFGLARTDDPVGSSSSFGDTPTLTTPAPSPTTPGVILGTAPYMSPEQARGRRVDKRTDIWSFGVVLFECLTGESPFRGETATDSIGAILHKGVDLDRLPPGTPFLVRHLLERCLMRDKDDRLRDIGDARLELSAARRDASEPAPVSGRRSAVAPIAALCIVAGGVIGGGAMWLAGTGAAPVSLRPLQFELPLRTPDGKAIIADQMVFSPDGSTLVIAPVGAGPLWVRDLDSFALRPIAGSADGWDPSFTPDGRSVVFQAPGGVFRASIDGGTPVQIYPSGGFYYQDLMCVEGGWIVGAEPGGQQLHRGHLDGRPFERFATALVDGEQLGFDNYTTVPGSPHLLACAYFDNRIDAYNIVAVSVEDGSVRTVLQNAASPAATADGRLIFMRDADLYAAPLDLDRLEVIGEATLVVDGVASDSWGSHSVYALAQTGELAYLPGARATRNRSIARIERDGAWAPIGTPDDYFENVYVSPNGAQAVVSTLRRALETWLFDLERGSLRRLTAEGEQYGMLWTPDGGSIVHQQIDADRGYDSMRLVVREARPGAPFRVLLEGEDIDPLGWMPDGETLLVDRRVRDSAGEFTWEFLAIPLDDPDSAQTLFTDSVLGRYWKNLSPDGRWLAYYSEESGGLELFVRELDAPDRVWQVSPSGAWYAVQPIWSLDSTTLHWVNEDAMYAATIEATDDGPRIGDAMRLFNTPWPQADTRWDRWDIGPDGAFFAVSPPDWELDPQPVRVMTNWSMPD